MLAKFKQRFRTNSTSSKDGDTIGSSANKSSSAPASSFPSFPNNNSSSGGTRSRKPASHSKSMGNLSFTIGYTAPSSSNIQEPVGDLLSTSHLVDSFVLIGMPSMEPIDDRYELGEQDVINPTDMIYKGEIIDCFQTSPPSSSSSSTPSSPSSLPPDEVPPHIWMFCFPQGAKVLAADPGPTYFPFILTALDGSRTYGSCLTFYEPLSKGSRDQWYKRFGSGGAPSDDDNNNGGNSNRKDRARSKITLGLKPQPSSSSSSATNAADGQNDVYEDSEYFVPKCLCLISRLPLYSIFRIWLNELYTSVIQKTSNVPIERYIYHILNEVPAPQPGGPLVKFSLQSLALSASRPPLPSLPYMDIPFRLVFNCLDIDNILLIFKCILLEEKIVFTSSHNTILTAAAEVIMCLIYPFSWLHVFVPILPELLMDFVYSPTPFIMGVPRAYIGPVNGELQDDVILVDLDANTVRLPSTVRDELTSSLPEKETSQLVTELRSVVNYITAWADLPHFDLQGAFGFQPAAQQAMFSLFDGGRQSKQLLKPPTGRIFDDYVQNAFLKYFCNLFHDYRQNIMYLRVFPKPIAMFNKVQFLETKPQEARDFLTRLMDTQAFANFLESHNWPSPSVFDTWLDTRRFRLPLWVDAEDHVPRNGSVLIAPSPDGLFPHAPSHAGGHQGSMSYIPTPQMLSSHQSGSGGATEANGQHEGTATSNGVSPPASPSLPSVPSSSSSSSSSASPLSTSGSTIPPPSPLGGLGGSIAAVAEAGKTFVYKGRLPRLAASNMPKQPRGHRIIEKPVSDTSATAISGVFPPTPSSPSSIGRHLYAGHPGSMPSPSYASPSPPPTPHQSGSSAPPPTPSTPYTVQKYLGQPPQSSSSSSALGTSSSSSASNDTITSSSQNITSVASSPSSTNPSSLSLTSNISTPLPSTPSAGSVNSSQSSLSSSTSPPSSPSPTRSASNNTINTTPIPAPALSPEEQDFTQTLERFFNQAFSAANTKDNNAIDQNDVLVILETLKYDYGRTIFGQYLMSNQYATGEPHGRLAIGPYLVLADVMQAALREAHANNDLNSPQKYMDAACLYHKIANGAQDYLYTHLKNQDIWQTQKFWEKFFYDKVEVSLRALYDHDIINHMRAWPQHPLDTQLKIVRDEEQLVFDLVFKMAFNMVNLALPPDTIRRFASKMCLSVSLDDEHTTIIMKLVGTMSTGHQIAEELSQDQLVQQDKDARLKLVFANSENYLPIGLASASGSGKDLFHSLLDEKTKVFGGGGNNNGPNGAGSSASSSSSSIGGGGASSSGGSSMLLGRDRGRTFSRRINLRSKWTERETLRRRDRSSIGLGMDKDRGEYIIRTFSGHDEAVLCVAMTRKANNAATIGPNKDKEAARLVTGSCDGTLKVWDAQSTVCLGTLQDHAGWVSVCEIDSSSADTSSRLVSGSYDHTLKIWDLVKCAKIRSLRGHKGSISALQLGTNRILSASYDNTIQSWDYRHGKSTLTLSGHSGPIMCMKWEDGSHYVVSGSRDTTARLWDLRTGKTVAIFAGHTDWVKCVYYNNNSNSSSSAAAPSGADSPSSSSSSSPSSSDPSTSASILTGGCDGVVKVWDPTDGKCTRTIAGHTGSINGLLPCKVGDSRKVLSYSADSTIRVHDLSSPSSSSSSSPSSEPQVLAGHIDEVVECGSFMSPTTVASCSFDGGLRIWDMTRAINNNNNSSSSSSNGGDGPAPARTLQLHNARISCLRTYENCIITAGWDKVAKLCEFSLDFRP